MIVGRGHGPVGEWWFEADAPTTPEGAKELRDLLGLCGMAAMVLERHGLLFADKVSCSGWLVGNFDAGTMRRVEHPDLVVDLPGTAADLVERAGAALLSGPADDFRYPVDIEITGTGIVLDADGAAHRCADVAWLSARTLAHHIVSVMVQSDAFLPYSVTGVAQDAVWQHNAPRLEAALAEVAQALGGIEPDSDKTPHAIVAGNRLLNRVDVEGDVVPTYLPRSGDEASR